jgi:DNA-binding response OmpR family regulator
MRVLITDPDSTHAELLSERLAALDHLVEKVATGEETLAQLAHRGPYDFLLLELELPDADGVSVCRQIRDSNDIPIIGLIQVGLDLDRVLCLQAGADDCLTKPYGVDELLARMDAVTRRTRWRPAQDRTIYHGSLAIDLRAREVRLDGRRIDLTRKEFGLLSVLAMHPGQVLSRHLLLAEVWDAARPDASGHPRTSRTVDTHVSALRQKLGAKEWIVSVRGIGFRLGSVS